MMSPIPVIAIFDIGKTNKKAFLFDQEYKIVFGKSESYDEVPDEDGFPSEDSGRLKQFIFDTVQAMRGLAGVDIRAINFSTFGATLGYIGYDGNITGPIYSYLKPIPPSFRKQFYDSYGGENELSFRTASPVLESLNSGMMLYRVKYDKPELFKRTRYALHLPQLASFLLTGKCYSDMTSIGCHTCLWDFERAQYHEWVTREGVLAKLAPIMSVHHVEKVTIDEQQYSVGIGLHDSSSALIPYIKTFKEPFVLISTGTWCISMNPFNQDPITKDELEHDCLCFLSYKGDPVKASRLFAGHEHSTQTKRLSEKFHKEEGYFRTLRFDASLIVSDKNEIQFQAGEAGNAMINCSKFSARSLNEFESYEQAYHQLVSDIITQQVFSTNLVIGSETVKSILVDGGFANNDVYMNLLAAAYSNYDVYAANVPQASALGAALVLHDQFSATGIPPDLITLKYFPGKHKAAT
jgi:sugar (pentulose or hexulose) kinase